MALFIKPLSIFFLVVVPLWLVLHYRSKRALGEGLSDEDRTRLFELSEQASRMAQRIDALETLLDAQVPDWRRSL
jgi:phage shock protein B